MSDLEASKRAPRIEQHSLGQSVALHLLPGILTGVLFFAFTRPVRDLGFPSVAALILAGIVIIVPFEAGTILYQAKRAGAKALEEIILYRQTGSVREYLIWVPVIFLSSGLIITALAPVTDYLQTLFAWLPKGFRLEMGLTETYSKSKLILTYSVYFVMISLVIPTVEELYFRGYLLPRMPRLKGWAPVLHSALFALYHTWTPWMAFTRTLAVLPLIYIVRWKRNATLGIIAHCLLNTIDVAVAVAFIVSMP